MQVQFTSLLTGINPWERAQIGDGIAQGDTFKRNMALMLLVINALVGTASPPGIANSSSDR